jgi:hypothetical protein
MLEEEQLETLIGSLNEEVKKLEGLRYFTETLRLSWRMIDEMGDVPSEVEQFLSKEQKSTLRHLYGYLQDMVNNASYLESFLDKKGNFVASREDESWEWKGTSTIKTRLVKLMHKLGHTPEEASDALVEVCHIEKWETQDYIKGIGSPYPDDFEGDELNKRLRLHVYGEEHERALAAKDYKAVLAARKRNKEDDNAV